MLESETEPKALEVLLDTLPFVSNWHPANALRNLGFINFFLRIIGIQTKAHYQYHVVYIKMESIKLILNTLRLATVSPGVINDMCEKINLKDSNATGIG